jgi:glycosyltransferase involved in cell wall biosynthesis
MHFIFLTLGYHPDLVGGAYRFVTELAVRLAKKNLVDVITPNPGPALGSHETRAEVEIHRYPNATGFFFQNWRRENEAAEAIMRDLLSESAVPVMVVNCHAFFGPTQAANQRPGAFLFTGPWAEEFRFARRAVQRSWPRRIMDEVIARRLHKTEQSALLGTQRLMTISRYYQAQLPRWHPVDLPPVKLVSGGVDHDHFSPSPDRAALRAGLGVEAGDFLFLAVRRLDPRMGLPVLLDGFARAAVDSPRARLWIAGKGPQRQELNELIESLKLGGQVRLLGLVAESELPGLYNAADCTVMPSLDLEGFGLVTLESLACGTPVIGSRAGANPELIGPLGQNLLFAPGSAAEIAEKFGEILRNPASLPARDRCREYAAQTYSWDSVAEIFEQTFTELFAIG